MKSKSNKSLPLLEMKQSKKSKLKLNMSVNENALENAGKLNIDDILNETRNKLNFKESQSKKTFKNIERMSDSDSEEPRTNLPEKLKTYDLERFISENPDLQKLKLSKFSKKMDICLLQIPKDIDPQFSLNQTISFENPTKIKINKEKFVLKPIEIDEPMAILTNKLKIIEKIPCLKLEKHIKEKQQETILPENETVIQNVPKTKVRHPLLGVDYKLKINLNEEIQKKLNEALENINKKPQKKKKPKVEKQEAIFELLESHKPIKQEKKQKKKDIVNSTMVSTNKIDFNPEISKIEKKRKISEITQKNEEDNLISELMKTVKCELKEKKHKKKRKFSDN